MTSSRPIKSEAPVTNHASKGWAYAPVIVLTLICAAAVLMASRSLKRYADDSRNERLVSAGNELASELQDKFARYEQLLQTARAFYEASPEVSRAQWAWFVDGIDLEGNEPSIIGLAFVSLVQPGSEDAFIARVQSSGMPKFRIFEPDENDRAGHTGAKYVITYHEPASRNRDVWGLDLASSSSDKRVYDTSSFFGSAQLSNTTAIRQTSASQRIGAVMCLPVSKVPLDRHGTPKREAPAGWVAMTLDLEAVIANTLDERWDGLDLQIHGGRPDSDPALWFSRSRLADTSPHQTEDMYRCKIDLYGNQVYLGWSPATPAWSESDYGRANIALIVGSIITVLVMLVGISVSRTRSKAVRLAYNMTLSLRESERQQRELASRAEQANLAKSEFLANMSHEIRTPMTAILGYTDILSASDRNPADTESLRVIRRAGEHLLTIINDVLDLTRIEAGRFEIEMATVEVAVLIEDVISGFHGLAADRGIELRLVLTSQIPSLVHTDNIRIRQILIHLIGNAIKFTEDGSVTLEVNFETDHLRLRVIDTGIGIGSEDIERIFSPFEQADNSASRHHNGTGLGLAISRKLAKMLDGELIAESEPGKGSVFTLTVRAPAEPDAAWMRVLGERAASPKPATSTMSLQGRVLLAEDGIDNQRLISYFLCNAGLDVDVVSNGREALDRLHEDQNYDIFITDMQMPVMDGYTTTMCLREMGNTIPILALTAHAMAGDRERCLAVGCNDYEPKPIDRESLIETVRRLLHNRAAHAERADAA